MKRILTGIWFLLLLVSCGNKKEVRDEDLFYTCSMDPQVVSDKPGNCPICGMPLTPVEKSSVENSDEIELSEQQVQLGNIHTDTILKGNIGQELELTGTLNLNAAQTMAVSARVAGRIEKLYVKTTGDYVAKGIPLYEIYSEELNNAKQEYIAALERRALFNEQSVIDFDRLIESAEHKLRLWGMTKDQVNELASRKRISSTTRFYSTASGYVTSVDVAEGGYVMDGGTIVQLADLSTLWAEVQVYTSQLYRVPTGAIARVQVPGTSRIIQGRIEFANPEVTTASGINLLRVVVPNAGNQLKPGMPVVVWIKTANRNSLTLPTDAVIRDANGATVWLQTGTNKFISRMVTTGMESGGRIEITSGLNSGEIVVTSGAYLLHSEFIFKRGADPMAGHGH